jgi:hypothetical protein
MCLFTRDGDDPMGPFVPYEHNPVVEAGQLWRPICTGPQKHCMPSMADEGTPEIVAKDEEG